MPRNIRTETSGIDYGTSFGGFSMTEVPDINIFIVRQSDSKGSIQKFSSSLPLTMADDEDQLVTKPFKFVTGK